MGSTFGTRVEIRKFDGKNFSLCKEMMQYVLIIQTQVEAIQHSEKPASMTVTAKECRSIDEITHSTIRMHLAENIYFSNNDNLGDDVILFVSEVTRLYEKKSSSSKLILIRQLFNMKMRETDPTTSHTNTFISVLTELSSQGINFEEEVKALALFSSLFVSWEVLCMTFSNNFPKLNLEETIGQILTEESRHSAKIDGTQYRLVGRSPPLNRVDQAI